MKQLLILRHAKSSWKDLMISDHARPLNKRGYRDAPRMGQELRSYDLCPNLIVSSTAKRAKTTATLVADEAGYEGEIILTRDFYHAPPETYIAYCQGLSDEIERVMVVGHNPGMEMLVSLLGKGINEFMPTAALAIFDVDVTHWSDFSAETPSHLIHLLLPRNL